MSSPAGLGPQPAAGPSYWCEWAWLGGAAVTAAVLLETAGGRITAVTPNAAQPAGAVPLPGITLPGLANVHSHAFHRALRGRTHRPGSFWSWREQMYALAERLTPDSYHALARAVFAEMALAGVTAVGEFHYLHHAPGGRRYTDPNAMGAALIAAAADAGIRITLLDTCYLAGGVDVPITGVQVRFSDGSATAWADRVEALAGAVGPAAPVRGPGPVARVGAAVHSVRAVPPGAIAEVARWAAERGAPLHVHLSEQPAENEACLAHYGRTPTELLAGAGALTAGTTAVHGTHLTVADRALLAGTGTGVCLCPTTEQELADGIGPAAALRSGGVPLSLGSDSQAVIDLLAEARAVELDERLATQTRGHFTAADLLTAATATGMRALGWDAGRIEPRRLADLATVGLGSVRLAGIRPADALEHLVFAGTAADITHTIVAGELIVADGRHRHLDPAAALRTALTPLDPNPVRTSTPG
ncbi:MAG TPA: formimidoylglutamate deiminase [Mycobacteriales bacterium]|nr:formimidoylglutamate deiminase [Mycobacteriales bacterium]